MKFILILLLLITIQASNGYCEQNTTGKVLINLDKKIAIPKPITSKLDSFYFYTENPVQVKPFYIQKFETTCSEFYNFAVSFVDKNKEMGSIEGLAGDDFIEKYECIDDDIPVSRVSWKMADNYCKSSDGRLPTQLEWITAAGISAARNSCYPDIIQGEFYPFPVKEFPVMQNTQLMGCIQTEIEMDDDDEALDPKKPGSEKYTISSSIININGTYGMFSNLWEWTDDDYVIDSDNSERRYKVIKGGSFANHNQPELYDVRIINFLDKDNSEMDNVGFRCAWGFILDFYP